MMVPEVAENLSASSLTQSPLVSTQVWPMTEGRVELISWLLVEVHELES
jgi:hypothetical protein